MACPIGTDGCAGIGRCAIAAQLRPLTLEIQQVQRDHPRSRATIEAVRRLENEYNRLEALARSCAAPAPYQAYGVALTAVLTVVGTALALYFQYWGQAGGT